MIDWTAIRVDKSRTYKINVKNPCPKCGLPKTWDRRIKNPKTGKMMPAHVTREGFLVNDGECPFWTDKKNDKMIYPSLGPESLFISRKNGKITLAIDNYPDISIRLTKDEFFAVFLKGFNLLYDE